MHWEPGVFGDEMANGFWSGLTPTQTWGGQQWVCSPWKLFGQAAFKSAGYRVSRLWAI